MAAAVEFADQSVPRVTSYVHDSDGRLVRTVAPDEG